MHTDSISLRHEFKDTLKLALPIVLNQAGHMSMGLVDTVVAGKIGTTQLAGLGLGSNFFWTFTSVSMGSLMALDAYFSQAYGSKDEATLGRYLGQSWWACLIVTILSGLAIALATTGYVVFGPEGRMREAFGTYVTWISLCLPTLFIFFVLQRYWQARHRVLPFTWMIVIGNVVNLAACLGLGLGYWGFPKLGVQGIALATVFSRYAMLLAAVLFTLRQLRPGSWRLPPFDRQVQKSLFRLGLPAAGHTGLEVGAFTLATFMAGMMGAAQLAAHHVSLMMAAFTFMFPLGFSAAAAVRVGMFVGARDPRRARLAGWLCMWTSAAVMVIFALVYVSVPASLMRLFTQDPEVVQTGVKILMIVALFQVADGIQVSTAGALRGIGNTRAAMFANLIGHYPVGLVLGLVLCFPLGLGVVGLWGGLACGLATVACLVVRAWHSKTRDLSKLQPLPSGAHVTSAGSGEPSSGP